MSEDHPRPPSPLLTYWPALTRFLTNHTHTFLFISYSYTHITDNHVIWLICSTVAIRYYTGEKTAPILTLVIGGNHEASNYMWEL